MRWLLTGGAGYIGAHVLRAMQAADLGVVAYDDLSTGDPGRVPAAVPLVVGSVLDGATLRRTFDEYQIGGVVHLAGKKAVAESVAEPLRYYRENIVGTLTLLEEMHAADVGRLVFSSSAAVYGTPTGESVEEISPTRPESPYGRSKLVGEWMVQDAAAAVGISTVSLRYFNVVGCAEPTLSDKGGTNLFPLVMRALVEGARPVVYGADYRTRDGSCIRDFIHVQDLAEAHVAAARLVESRRCAETVNIGCGNGHTVLEVLETVGQVTGRDTTPAILPRRPGDPVRMVATAVKAEQLLGWRANRGIEAMVRSAWEAHHTDGAAQPLSGNDGGPAPGPAVAVA
jgi:UDP-glucose 4-epimerase